MNEYSLAKVQIIILCKAIAGGFFFNAKQLMIINGLINDNYMFIFLHVKT